MKIKQVLGLIAATLFAIGDSSGEERFVSSSAERTALFDQLLDSVLRREAFSPFKNTHFGTDIEADLRARRGEFSAADTSEKLYYALVRFSNTRRDRHLKVYEVPDGVAPNAIVGGHAPVRFATDFSVPGSYSLFVSDVAPPQFPAGVSISPGDLVISINGRTVADHARLVTPYMRHSTWNGLWYRIAENLPELSTLLPPDLRSNKLNLVLEGSDGSRRSVSLPYYDEYTLDWAGHDAVVYADFVQVFATPTYTLFRHPSRQVLLLQWHGFEGSLRSDVDQLMRWAKREKVLNHDLIIDATRSGGGSQGAYAVQRFSPKPFKTTFGNLRISDITADFIEMESAALENSTVTEDQWLLDWLKNDVTADIAAGKAYTNNVPFKLAHAPKTSNGVLSPAPEHFKGKLVVLLSPNGGSHLDQFAAMIKDNDLGRIIGLPAGGYSNTWEWTETITMPGSNTPVIDFMWNIGHTIRPNGEVLESNPAIPNDVFPPSRANRGSYHAQLLQRAFAWLDNPTLPPGPPVITEGNGPLSVTMDEDASPTAFTLTLNAADSNGDTLTWSVTSPPAQGMATGAGTGTSKIITYVPPLDWHGSVSFTVQVSDGASTDSVVVSVTVNPRNDPPVNLTTAPPTVTGDSNVGSTMTAQTGTWNDSKDKVPGALTYSYQWQVASDVSGTATTDIPGANAATYLVTSANAGKHLRVRITCTDNGEGMPATASSVAFSAWLKIPGGGGSAPLNTGKKKDGNSCGLGSSIAVLGGLFFLGIAARFRRDRKNSSY